MSASSRMTAADLPPSSRVHRAIRSPQMEAIRRPAAVDPVKVILSTRGSRTSSSETSRSAVTTLRTPAGQARRLGRLGHQVALARCFRGGLEDHGAAGQQRRRDLVADQAHRGVPRDDRADDADRLADEQAELARPTADRLLEGVRVGQRGERVEGGLRATDRRTGRWRAGRRTRGARSGRGRRIACSARRPSPAGSSARSSWVSRGQGPLSNASRAASTASEMSAACASATVK